MNKLKLMYVRWKNTSKWRNRRICRKMTVEDVFCNIKFINTYPERLHNNLKLYRVMKKNPKSKIVKIMFMEGHLRLFSLKSTWKFAKQVHKIRKEKWGV